MAFGSCRGLFFFLSRNVNYRIRTFFPVYVITPLPLPLSTVDVPLYASRVFAIFSNGRKKQMPAAIEHRVAGHYCAAVDENRIDFRFLPTKSSFIRYRRIHKLRLPCGYIVGYYTSGTRSPFNLITKT